MKNIKYIYLLLTLSIISCDDYLDIEPVGQVIPRSVDEYRSFLTSAYSTAKNYKVLTTYRTDELMLEDDAPGIEVYEDVFIWNDLNPSPLVTPFPYASLYTTIFYANHVIENSLIIEGNEPEKDQLVGEAYALRAMQYFELVNLYGKTYSVATASSDPGVPVTTVYDSEKQYPVQTVQEVYNLIISDIEKAEELLNVDAQETGFNYRFSMVAIKSFKSRVYLFQNEWQKAIDLANDALAIKAELQDLNTETSIMASEYNSIESILALETIASFDLANNANISNDLLNAYDQVNDLRFTTYFNENSNGSYSSKKSADNKFKSSYRTAELYLTIAESNAQLNELDLAKQKLIEFAKNRYTLAGWEAYKLKVASMNKSDLISEILEERRREFAIEGHRWNDLRRTTQQKLTKTFRGKTYILNQGDERYVIPFPKDAVINNPNL